ncbi:MAG: YqgE/AlgH family protein [Deltaproteobacteria bacterium]|nr:YqgE/AlgH family protein [Deltaproteobacteria bacterium]
MTGMETQLAPGFLVASPQMKDPFFARTVIFLLEHDHSEGTFGIILNKTADIGMADVYAELDIPVAEEVLQRGLPPVLEGGPVTPELGWLIHSLDWAGDKTRVFENEVGVTASLDLLRDIAEGAGPSRFLFCLGYSGWGPHQLMKEIQTGSWLYVPFTSELFFDGNRETLWETAIARIGIDPAYFSPLTGGA